MKKRVFSVLMCFCVLFSAISILEFSANAYSYTNNSDADSYSNLYDKFSDLLDSGEEMLKFIYRDFDFNGSHEAFVVTTYPEDNIDDFNAYIWFVHNNKVTYVSSINYYDSDVLIDNLCNEISFGNYHFVTFDTKNGNRLYSLLFGVINGEPEELNLSGNGLIRYEENIDSVLVETSDFDATLDGTGHTFKPYYYWWSNDLGEFVEYGGMRIDERDLLKCKGTQTILSKIKDYNYKITDIYIRENGIINVNFTHEIYNDNATLLYNEKYNNVALLQDGDYNSENEILKSSYGGVYEATIGECYSLPKSIPWGNEKMSYKNQREGFIKFVDENFNYLSTNTFIGGQNTDETIGVASTYIKDFNNDGYLELLIFEITKENNLEMKLYCYNNYCNRDICLYDSYIMLYSFNYNCHKAFDVYYKDGKIGAISDWMSYSGSMWSSRFSIFCIKRKNIIVDYNYVKDIRNAFYNTYDFEERISGKEYYDEDEFTSVVKQIDYFKGHVALKNYSEGEHIDLYCLGLSNNIEDDDCEHILNISDKLLNISDKYGNFGSRFYYKFYIYGYIELIYESAPNGFTIGKNNNKFIHNNCLAEDGNLIENLEYEKYGFLKKKNYLISDDLLKAKLYELSCFNGRLSLIQEKMNENWNGSCYGIAATMGLIYNNVLDIKDISSSYSKNYYLLDFPYKNSKLSDAINFYYLSQFLENYGTDSKLCTSGFKNIFIDNKYFDKFNSYFLNDYYKLLINDLKNNDTMLLGYSHKYVDNEGKTKTSGHAIITCGIEQLEDGTNDVWLYDENCVEHFDHLFLKENNGKFDVKYKCGNTYTNLPNELLIMYHIPLDNILGDLFCTESVSKKTSTKNENSTTVIIDCNYACDLYNSNNQNVISYNGKQIDSDFNIKDFRFIANNTSYNKNALYEITFEHQDGLVYNSKAKETHIISFDNDNYISVKGNNIESVVIDNMDIAQIKGSNYSFEATINRIVNNENQIVSIDGNAKDNVELSIDKNNDIHLVSDSKITDVDIEISDNSGSIQLNSNDSKSIVVAADCHKFTSKVVPSTCISKGYTLHNCIFCGCNYKDCYTKVAPHTYDNGRITKKATCLKDGEKTYTCKVCNSKKIEKIKKIAHKYQLVEYKKATYFAKGKKQYKCLICKKATKTIVLSKLKLKTPKVNIKAGKKRILVKYNKVKGATGFQVKYTFKGKIVTKGFYSKKLLTKSIIKLKNGLYKVQVRAFVKNGNKYAYSSWTKLKTINVM